VTRFLNVKLKHLILNSKVKESEYLSIMLLHTQKMRELSMDKISKNQGVSEQFRMWIRRMTRRSKETARDLKFAVINNCLHESNIHR
jgi:hypothetical protein